MDDTYKKYIPTSGSAEDLGRSIDAAKQQPKRPQEDHGKSANGRPRVACLTNRLLDWENRQPHWGGAEKYCVQLGALLRDLGLDITFFQASNEPFEGEYYGFPVVGLGPGEFYSEFQYGVCDSFYAATLDFDHVIYHMPNYATGRVREDALMICHCIWFDYESSFQGILFRTPEWFRHLYRAFSQPSRIVSVDTNSINVIRALWPELGSRMTYLPNWVDTRQFRPPDRPRSSSLKVLFARRSEVVKGAAILASILDKVPHDCRFAWWVGEGTEGGTEMVKAAARSDPRLELYSTNAYENMPEIYREADICVIPSIGSEGTSLTCLEALASGCAVVATNIGGLPDLIQPGVNGLLVDPAPEQIAAAINRLIEQPNERERMQRAGRLTAERFRLEVWQQRWTDLLRSIEWIDRSAKSSTIPISDEPCSASMVSVAATASETSAAFRASRISRETLYDVICFSIIDWEFRWQRPQQLMSRFAASGHRVFFISISRFREERYEAVPLAENIWEIRLGIPRSVDVYAGTLPVGFARLIVESLKSLRTDFEITRAVSVVEIASWARAAYEARDLLGWPVVYDCMDNWSSFPSLETRTDLIGEERLLVKDADLLVVSSQSLWEKWSRHNSNSLLARNAADFGTFFGAESGQLLNGVRHPIVGYFGAIADWFDLELMVCLARERLNYTFVLIGEVFGIPMNRLEALPNVLILGHQPYHLMPGYLAAFDVCIIPFLVNPATDSMDVVKFYEYSSQGKPVVSTRIGEMIENPGHVYLAQDHDEFLSQLDRAVSEQDPKLREERVRFASKNTWDNRVKDIDQGIRRAERLRAITGLVKDLNRAALQDGDCSESPLQDDAELILNLEIGFAAREQAVRILSERLSERDRVLAEREKAVQSRDVLLSEKGRALAAGEQALRTLTAELSERDSTMTELRAQIGEKDAVVASLRVDAEATERALQQLSNRLEETIQEERELGNRAIENEQALKRALEVSSEMTRAVATLRAQIAEEDRRAEVISIQLAEAERSLSRIRNIRGWRLLSRILRVDAGLRQMIDRTGSITASSEGELVNLSWSCDGVAMVEVHVSDPDGPLFARTGPNGSGSLDWLHEKTTFFLQDVTGGLPLSLSHTLATVTVVPR